MAENGDVGVVDGVPGLTDMSPGVSGDSDVSAATAAITSSTLEDTVALFGVNAPDDISNFTPHGGGLCEVEGPDSSLIRS